MVDDSNDLIIISSDGIMIRIPASQISTVARGAKGVRVMRVNENERIVSVVAVAHDEEEAAEFPEQTAEDASQQNENAALSGAEEKAEE